MGASSCAKVTTRNVAAVSAVSEALDCVAGGHGCGMASGDPRANGLTVRAHIELLRRKSPKTVGSRHASAGGPNGTRVCRLVTMQIGERARVSAQVIAQETIKLG